MLPSARRVASRHIVAANEVAHANFVSSLRIMKLLVAEAKVIPTNQYGSPGNWHKSPSLPDGYSLRSTFGQFIQAGRTWSERIIDAKAIPAGKHKGVEMAVRLLAKARFPKPEAVPAWFEGNVHRFDLLAEAGAWPDRTAESDVRVIGPFRVHDTVGSSEADWTRAEQVITRVVALTRNTDLLGFAGVAYGDVYLVGQIARKGWAAWYNSAKDLIYLRPNLKGISVEEAARIFTHELAHRYWYKTLPKTRKDAWEQHHANMVYALKYSSYGRVPEVGEVLPAVVNGHKVKVESVGPHTMNLALASTGEFLMQVPTYKIRELMGRVENTAKFPTTYAATAAEEHFAEAVSMYALGTLKPDNAEAYQRVLVG